MFLRYLSLSGIFGVAAMFLLGSNVFAGEPGNWHGWYTGAFGSYVSGSLNSDDPTHAESTKDYKDDMPMIGFGGGIQQAVRERLGCGR